MWGKGGFLIMFCTKCGRQLADGEVCNCQAGEQAQAAKPVISMEQATEISKGALDFVKGFFKDPVAASESVVGAHSVVTVAVLVLANLFMSVLYTVVYRIMSVIKYKSKFDFLGLLKSILENVVWWVAIPAALAGIIWLCAKFIEKSETDFKTALSVCAVPAIPMLMFAVIDFLRIILSHSFFYVVFRFIETGIGGMMFVLTAVAVKKAIGKSDKFLYTSGAICAGLWFVNWLVSTVIF